MVVAKGIIWHMVKLAVVFLVSSRGKKNYIFEKCGNSKLYNFFLITAMTIVSCWKNMCHIDQCPRCKAVITSSDGAVSDASRV